jgi:hypothetical protein
MYYITRFDLGVSFFSVAKPVVNVKGAVADGPCSRDISSEGFFFFEQSEGYRNGAVVGVGNLR